MSDIADQQNTDRPDEKDGVGSPESDDYARGYKHWEHLGDLSHLHSRPIGPRKREADDYWRYVDSLPNTGVLDLPPGPFGLRGKWTRRLTFPLLRPFGPMTGRRLGQWIFWFLVYCVVYVSVFLALDASTQTQLARLTTFIFGAPAAWIAYCFQRRLTLVRRLDTWVEEWRLTSDATRKAVEHFQEIVESDRWGDRDTKLAEEIYDRLHRAEMTVGRLLGLRWVPVVDTLASVLLQVFDPVPPRDEWNEWRKWILSRLDDDLSLDAEAQMLDYFYS